MFRLNCIEILYTENIIDIKVDKTLLADYRHIDIKTQSTYDRGDERMGRVPEPATEDRFGLHGEPEMPGKDGAGYQGPGLPARFRYSVGKRRGGQGNNSFYDISTWTQQKSLLLQQTTR